MKNFVVVVAGCAAVFSAIPAWAGGTHHNPKLSEEEIRTMVVEIQSVLPQDPALKYPIDVRVIPNATVNAFAWHEKHEGDSKDTAIVRIYTGLLDFIDNDPNMLRAVLAHECSHLALRHTTDRKFSLDPKDGPVVSDAARAETRQIEYAADSSGASVLQQLGYGKQMEANMLLKLADLDKGSPSVDRLCADHADPRARAAEIVDDPHVLRAILQYEAGMLYADSHRWIMAKLFFDDAAAIEPKLTEAKANAAQAWLNDYYDQLAGSVRGQWLIPDFGPLFPLPTTTAQGAGIDDSDRERYNAAKKKVDEAVAALPNVRRPKELQALALVLEPDGNPNALRRGVLMLRAMLKDTPVASDRVGVANNLALGLQRLGNVDASHQVLVEAASYSPKPHPAIDENLGLILPSHLTTEAAKVGRKATRAWLSMNSSKAALYDRVFKGYSAYSAELKLPATPVVASEVLGPASSIKFFDGSEVGVFSTIEHAQGVLGIPEKIIAMEEKYPDFEELHWRSGSITALGERDHLMRVTSYMPGSYVILPRGNANGQDGLQIKVGMKLSDLEKSLPLMSGAMRTFVRGPDQEDWYYWPDLQTGVTISDDGRVAGLTVVPGIS